MRVCVSGEGREGGGGEGEGGRGLRRVGQLCSAACEAEVGLRDRHADGVDGVDAEVVRHSTRQALQARKVNEEAEGERGEWEAR